MQIWSLMAALWSYLPWIAIGFMAGLAFRKRRESRSLMLQAAGACSMFLLGAAQWIVVDFLLVFFRATPGVISFSRNIFSFLLFVALAAFAVGYCAERLKRSNRAIQVSATPAD